MLSIDHRNLVQRALPGYMLALVLESLEKTTGFTIRADLMELANKASAGVLLGLPEHMRGIIAKEVESSGYGILKASNQDHLPTLLASVSVMLTTFQKRGLPVEENAMLVALALAQEALEDEDDWGRAPEIISTAKKLENETSRRGYFKFLETLH